MQMVMVDGIIFFRLVMSYSKAFTIPAARCSAVGFSAQQLTDSPSAIMASAVVGPMAEN